MEFNLNNGNATQRETIYNDITQQYSEAKIQELSDVIFGEGIENKLNGSFKF